MKTAALVLSLIALISLDQSDHWIVKWNSETVLDSREISNFSFWDYHTFVIDKLSENDTIRIKRRRCMIYPGSIEQFLIVDVNTNQIVKELKFLGNSNLNITTKELFAGNEELDNVKVYHFAQVEGTEPKPIVEVKRKQ